MRTIIYLILLIILPLPLFGYLDPGSGSMLFSALVGIVATLFFVAKGVFFKIVDIPSYIMGIKRGKRKKYSIVIYSEGPQYYNVFLPLLREFSKRKISCTYMTSKENDPGLKFESEFVDAKFIGTGTKAFITLNTLEADVVILTTPGLDVLQIKRSKGVKKYIHITHSSGGLSGYSTFGTDYFDAVLTGGEADKNFIKEIEEIRGINKKELIEVGCTYLDVMREKLASPEFSSAPASERKTVLVSPTWGNHGLLKKYGKELLQKLADSQKFNIIVRPHPQSHISDKEMMAELTSMFAENEFFHWDTAPDGLRSMNSADIMISDFSGIIFDFILLLKKPVLSFSAAYDRRGKDSMDYPHDPWNIDFINRSGIMIDPEQMPQITEKVEASLNDGISEEIYDYVRNSMDKFQNEAGKRAVDAIIEISKESN